MVCGFNPFPVFSHLHKRFATFRIGFTQPLRIKPAGVPEPPFLVIHTNIENAYRLFLPCLTHSLQIILHLGKIRFKASRPLCGNWVNVHFYPADVKPVLVKRIKQHIFTLICGKLHYHIKVRAFPFQAPAPAPGYCHIHNLRINSGFL